MKIYEIITVLIFGLFIVYYNLIYNEEISVVGCIELGATNYNSSANKACIDCCDWGSDKDCSKEQHPCLCSTEKNNGISKCAEIKLPPLLKTLKELSYNSDSPSSIQFQKLINSAYTEYYYSKIMEISQITYMDYVHSDDSEKSLKTPQYDIFLSIEFLKIGDYQNSLKHINKFLAAPQIYNSDRIGSFFNNGVGCCNSDIDWITDSNHDSFKIATIIKDILINLESEQINDQYLKDKFNQLMKFDQTDNSIDFIENLIFSILFSIEGYSVDFSNYGLKSLEEYDNILLSSFKNIFKHKNASFYLSSQIDIIVYLKLTFAENLLETLNDNDPFNSFLDIKALMRFIELQLQYDSNLIESAKDIMIEENKIINEKFNELGELSELLDPVDFNQIENQLSDFYGGNQKAGDAIIKDYYSSFQSNDNVSFSDIKMLANSKNIDSSSFFIKSRAMIDYNIFIQSIERFSENQWYPIFEQGLVEDLDKINNNKYLQSLSREFKYFIGDEDFLIFHNDIELLEVLRLLFGLQSPDKFNKIKTILDSHQENEIASNILIKSLSAWNQAINGK